MIYLTDNREPLVIVENLKTNFVTWRGMVRALNGVSFTIHKGEVLGLVGETGCGKSVTSYSIMSLIPPTQGAVVEGKITFRGEDLTKYKGYDVNIRYKRKKYRLKYRYGRYKKVQNYMNKYRGTGMAMIFQEPMSSLNPVYTIGFQLTEPLVVHSKEMLATRLLAKARISNDTFKKLKISVLNNTVDSSINYEDRYVKVIYEQMKAIKLRTDITTLQKNEYIDKLTDTGKIKINVLILKFLDYILKNNGKLPIYAKIPYIKKYFMKPLLKEAGLKAAELLRTVSIYDPEKILRMYPHELSGGMKQRCVIAMALACDPALLIADEPTTALDVTTQAQILDLIKDLKNRINSSILFITHDLGVISDIADRVAVMYGGDIAEIGNKMDIFSNPHHPYTQGLLRSIPTESTPRGDRLKIIPGAIPNMLDPPPGCRFHPRCQYKMDICDKVKPNPVEVEPDHYVSCYLYGGEQ
ncbi:MAG: ABC transporter ATP-binding protein [Candidatus Thermoplasmatota archaeon]|nr:ABC transporter ATP-binding protein [Candidatus Thermoplasmatota archaeon]MCL5964067.1 ABC transporter ATP-binding protein [Candidatus Thermoplasmatota archaeon]